MEVMEGALATLRTRCKLWVFLGTLLMITATIKRPPGKNDCPKATIQKPRKTGLVLATKLFSGSMGCSGGCVLGWCTRV